MKLGIGLMFVAWYSFVFAMCYFFSPWFVLLLLFSPQYTREYIRNNKSEADEKTSINPTDSSSKEK